MKQPHPIGAVALATALIVVLVWLGLSIWPVAQSDTNGARARRMPDINTASIAGLWVHSHEEDHPGTQVFRHPGYPFPRSRGRTSYELRPDGTLGGTRPGPDDRYVATAGRWDLQGSRLTITPEAGLSVQYDIEKLEADRMLVKPVVKP